MTFPDGLIAGLGILDVVLLVISAFTLMRILRLQKEFLRDS